MTLATVVTSVGCDVDLGVEDPIVWSSRSSKGLVVGDSWNSIPSESDDVSPMSPNRTLAAGATGLRLLLVHSIVGFGGIVGFFFGGVGGMVSVISS